MYKLKLSLEPGYKLALEPRRSNEIKKIFIENTYWYPQKIEGKQFVSLNISSKKTLEKFIPLARSDGNVFGEFLINDNDVCHIYSGTLSTNRLSAFLGLRPLFAGDEHLTYFLPDEDFKNNICQTIKKYVHDILKTGDIDSLSLTNKDLKVLEKIEKTPLASIDKNLNLYSRFFEIYSGVDSVKAQILHGKPCEYCTPKVGLHLLLHIVRLVPLETWVEKSYKDLFVYLLQQDFLGEWIDLAELDETRRKIILTEAIKIVPSIRDAQELNKIVLKIIESIVNRHDIFKTIYFLSRYEGGSATLKKIFDNLFNQLPKKIKESLFHPTFQPKLFIDGFELQFIIMSATGEKIRRMIKSLGEICDDIDFSRSGSYVHTPKLRNRYRVICKIDRGSYFVDYQDFPNVIGEICFAIKAIAQRNRLEFYENEAWLKRITIKIVTPLKFGDAALRAFSTKWVLYTKWVFQHKVQEDVEEVLLFCMGAGLEGLLDRGIIPGEFRDKLKNKNFSVSERAFVKKEGDNEWTVVDDDAIFTVRKVNRKLNTYAMLKGKIISAEVFCDYPSIGSHKFKFKYLRDVQSNYVTLNKLLEEEFNFRMIG